MVTVHLDNLKYENKPSHKEIGKISNRICQNKVNFTPKELAQHLVDGYSVVFGIMKDDKREKNNLDYQELVALDFDNNVNIKQILSDSFTQKYACFAYTTFNHTENNHRFRLVFKLDIKLHNNDDVAYIYEELFKKYNYQLDTSCKDSSRIFFGGLDYFEIDFNNYLPVDILINDFTSQKPQLIVDNTTINIEEKPTYWLIRHGYDDIVNDRLKKYKASVNNKSTAIEYIKSLNMGELLELPTDKNFHDLFSKDNNPSANIYHYDEGNVWLYTRHSSDINKKFTGNIIQVIQKLKSVHFIGALDYLIRIMNIDFKQTEEIKQKTEEIDIYTSLLLSSDLKVTYPSLAKIFKDGRSNYAKDVVSILNILKNNVIEINGENRMITELSARELSTRLYGNENKKNRIQRVINLMAVTGWINKLPTNELPEDIYKKVVPFQKQNNRRYHKNTLEVNRLGTDFFGLLNNYCEVMLGKGFTAAILSKEGLEFSFGKGVADKVFTQDTDREISNLTKEIEEVAIELIKNKVKNKGYIEEREVIKYISRYLGKKVSEIKIKQLRTQIVEGYGFQRVRLNKRLKKELDVYEKYTPTQSPFIYKEA